MRFRVVDSEGFDARSKRRSSVGQSAGESLAIFLETLEPGAETTLTTPADGDARVWTPDQLEALDAVFLSGSPLHIYDGSVESKREIAFMGAVFASGTPSFGSCAGLQVAVAAAGGTVRPMAKRREAGFARRIVPTDAGPHPSAAVGPTASLARSLSMATRWNSCPPGGPCWRSTPRWPFRRRRSGTIAVCSGAFSTIRN